MGRATFYISIHTKTEKLQKLTFTLFLFLFSLVVVSAQQGVVKGKVFDADLGESLISVTVAVVETGEGTVTDFDGEFILSLDPGTYTLEVSYVSYETQTISDVVVTAGQEVVLETIQLGAESELIDEIVITAEVIRSSETALMTIKRKSASLMDGISASKFEKIGDSDASQAVKRVTGVSVEGGKYVYVRGLGDRYTKTLLNGMEVPGLDPDRNSMQIDIFPTNLLNNITVHKSSLAELPADYTGGIVNIETKSFPEERSLDLSFGLGYNPSMHLNSDFVTAPKSSTDFLGFDDGLRGLPKGADATLIPTPISGHRVEDVNTFVNDFSPNLGTSRTTALPDFSLGLTYGDRKTFENEHELGYTFTGTYKSSRTYYDNIIYVDYQIPGESDVTELVRANTIQGQTGIENVLLGGMAGVAYKAGKTKHKVSLMHLQSGESGASQLSIDNNSDATGQSGYIAFSDNIEYSQRSVTNLLVNGDYELKNDLELDWNLSSTLSKLTDPDIRKTAFSEVAGTDLQFVAGAGGDPSRIWRFLEEVNHAGKIDFKKKFQLFSEEATFKFGAGHVLKERDFNILSYRLNFFGSQPEWTGDASEVVTADNLYPNGSIYYASGNNSPNPNEYNSTINNTSVYAAGEFNPLPSLKATVGLRAEKYIQRHTGRDSEFANSGTNGNNLDNEAVSYTHLTLPTICSV